MLYDKGRAFLDCTAHVQRLNTNNIDLGVMHYIRRNWTRQYLCSILVAVLLLNHPFDQYG
eukprot:m.943589 g.943589  ORF g.943589 m.943589 type:complete len:60 (-) comp23840_c0_seq29:130-309(-)